MNSSLRGASLSGLVFPGLGQIVQKHYFRGIALIGICTTSLLWVLPTVSREAKTILATIESGSAGDDISSILRETAKLTDGRDSAAMGVPSVLLLSCWVIGIVDAYVSGKKIDSKNVKDCHGRGKAREAKRSSTERMDMDGTTPRESFFKRMALSGLALPYIVSLSLTLAVTSIAGHSGYSAPAEELALYERIVQYATWSALTLSGLLSLPYGVGSIRERIRLQTGWARKMVGGIAWTIAYAGILAVNGLFVMFARGMARMALEGMQ